MEFSDVIDSQKLELGDKLNGSSLEFDVVTQIINNDVWSKNVTNKRYTNTVVLSEGDDQIAEDTASHLITKTFVTKSATDFDYSDHTITYTIALNKSNIAIGHVIVTDNLKNAGLEFIDAGSLKVNGITHSQYEYKDGILEITGIDFDADDADKTITFKAKVTDNTINSIDNGGSIDITNVVKVTTSDNPDGQEASVVTKGIVNKILSKKGTFDETSGLAKYTVQINGMQQKLPSGTTIEDTLGASLELDTDSVKLYEATIDSNGTFIKGTEYSDKTVKIESKNNKTVLSVRLNAETNKAFILEYAASPEYKEYKDYSNSVRMVGFNESESKVASASFSINVSSSASSESLRRFILKVYDEETNKPLSGVSFDILKSNDKNAEKIISLTTKSNGEARAINKLVPGKTYYLVQTTSPDGYVYDGQIIPITIDGKKYEYPVPLNQKTTKVRFNLIDNEGVGLKNGKLTLKRLSNPQKGLEEKIIYDGYVTDGSFVDLDVNYDTVYKLSEIAVPFGYNVLDSQKNVEFKVVDLNGKDILKLKDADGEFGEGFEEKDVTITNSPKDTYSFSVRNISYDQEKRLIGSKFYITEMDDDTRLKEWTTIDSDEIVALPEGKYVLVQSDVPIGYIKSNPIAFVVEISNDGDSFELKIEDLDETENQLVSFDDEDHLLIIKNEVDTNVVKDVEIVNLDTEGNRLLGAKVTISSGERNGIKCVTATDLVPNNAEKSSVSLNYQTVYTLEQDEVPIGYEKAKTVEFKLNNDGDVVYKQMDGSYEKKNDQPIVEIVNDKITVEPEKPVNNDTDTEQPSLGDKPAQTQPSSGDKPAKTQPENKGNKNQGNKNQDGKDQGDKKPEKSGDKKGNNPKPEKDNNDIFEPIQDVHSKEIKDEYEHSDLSENNDEVVGDFSNKISKKTVSDNNIDSAFDNDTNNIQGEVNNARRLAKTGGFIGTLFSYAFGIAFLLGGLYLIFGKKNEKK